MTRYRHTTAPTAPEATSVCNMNAPHDLVRCGVASSGHDVGTDASRHDASQQHSACITLVHSACITLVQQLSHASNFFQTWPSYYTHVQETIKQWPCGRVAAWQNTWQGMTQTLHTPLNASRSHHTSQCDGCGLQGGGMRASRPGKEHLAPGIRSSRPPGRPTAACGREHGG